MKSSRRDYLLYVLENQNFSKEEKRSAESELNKNNKDDFDELMNEMRKLEIAVEIGMKRGLIPEPIRLFLLNVLNEMLDSLQPSKLRKDDEN